MGHDTPPIVALYTYYFVICLNTIMALTTINTPYSNTNHHIFSTGLSTTTHHIKQASIQPSANALSMLTPFAYPDSVLSKHVALLHPRIVTSCRVLLAVTQFGLR